MNVRREREQEWLLPQTRRGRQDNRESQDRSCLSSSSSGLPFIGCKRSLTFFLFYLHTPLLQTSIHHHHPLLLHQQHLLLYRRRTRIRSLRHQLSNVRFTFALSFINRAETKLPDLKLHVICHENSNIWSRWQQSCFVRVKEGGREKKSSSASPTKLVLPSYHPCTSSLRSQWSRLLLFPSRQKQEKQMPKSKSLVIRICD